MINKKKYLNNIYFNSLLFYSGLLSNTDIIDIANTLTNNGNDNDFLVDIILDKADSNKIKDYFNLFLRSINLYIENKELAKKKAIIFIFEEILKNKIDFMNGIKFIIDNFQDYKKDKKTVGEYFDISNIIGIYYKIDDNEITNKEDIQKALDIANYEITNYLFKYAK